MKPFSYLSLNVLELLAKPLIFLPECRVTAEVKHNATNVVACRVQGEWNGALEFTYTSGETKVIDVTKLPVTRKQVRPVEKQGPTESRLERNWNLPCDCVVMWARLAD